MADGRRLLRELESLPGSGSCLGDPAARQVYSRDASHMTIGLPLCVCLPAASDEAAGIVSACVRAGVPFVARGAGTGLSGGALPPEGAVVVSLARLDGLGAVDPVNCTVDVGPGAVNLRVSEHCAAAGLEFAPDPSSESASTIGGNIAENAGGPHCLRVGVTVQHVRSLRWVDPGGRIRATGRGLSAERGIDLTALLTGSEGTLGVVVEARLGLTPRPEAASTLLALFPDLDAAPRAVVAMLAGGMLPAALEMIDRQMLAVVEQAFAFGFPTDAAAALIVEFAGSAESTAEDAARARELLDGFGAEVRLAADAAERQDLWRCRKHAFGAVGRLAPAYVTMDVAVPVGRLPDIVRRVQSEGEKHDVRIATALHAGDGNLHPGVMYDDRDPDSAARAQAAADAIVTAALEMGGTVTGEHGVGIEKRHLLGRQLDPEAVRLMAAIKDHCDPDALCNPGKALPESGDSPPPPPPPEAADFAWDSLTVGAPASADLARLQDAAIERGFWIPIGAFPPGTTVGDLVDHPFASPAPLAGGPVRDPLLEVWAATGDGRRFHAGTPCAKNVAGYDLARLVCGSGGTLARVEGATFLLRPVPESVGFWRWKAAGDLGREAMASLRGILLGHPADAGSPAIRLAGGELTVAAPGRVRDWHLGALGRDLLRWAAESGLADPEPGILPFAEAFAEVSGWTSAAGDWSLLARKAGGPAWPDLPRGAGFLWQGAPEILWLPAEAPAGAEGWHRDRVRVAGRPADLPEPGLDVPLDLLRGLKRIFDPRGTLPAPPWLLSETTGEEGEAR